MVNDGKKAYSKGYSVSRDNRSRDYMDFNTTMVYHIKRRVFEKDYRDKRSLKPNKLYNIFTEPPMGIYILLLLYIILYILNIRLYNIFYWH